MRNNFKGDFMRVFLIGVGLLSLAAFGHAAAADKSAAAFQVTPAHNAEVSFANTWGPALRPKWSAKLDGTPSYPLVADGLVYALVAASTAEIVALNPVNGQPVWKASAGAQTITGIAYDKQLVFAVSQAGTVTAYSGTTGALAWTTKIPGSAIYSAPPSALNGIVYVGGGGALYAFSAKTGKTIWTQPVQNGDNSSPAVTPKGVYVTYPCQYYDFDPKTGHPIWHLNNGCDGGGGTTPVVADGDVFVRDTSSNSVLDAATGAVIGSFAAFAPPAIGDKTGYFLNGNTLSAVDAKSQLLWTFTGDGTVSSAPLLINNWVIEASASHLYLLVGATGEEKWNGPLRGLPPGASLGAGGNLVLVPAGATLVAFISTI